jgi:hypothetical protein
MNEVILGDHALAGTDHLAGLLQRRLSSDVVDALQRDRFEVCTTPMGIVLPSLTGFWPARRVGWRPRRGVGGTLKPSEERGIMPDTHGTRVRNPVTTRRVDLRRRGRRWVLGCVRRFRLRARLETTDGNRGGRITVGCTASRALTRCRPAVKSWNFGIPTVFWQSKRGLQNYSSPTRPPRSSRFGQVSTERHSSPVARR